MESRNGSITPNSMMVLERGAGGVTTLVGPASRPPSGRRSRNKTPIQRSGSQLEVLPPSEDGKAGARPSVRSNSRPSSRSGSTEDSDRQSHSAGTSGRRSGQGQGSHDGLNRSNSLDSGISPREEGQSRPGSAAAHKQVSLMTVKRNYEMHGIPKNENWEFVPKDLSDFAPLLTNGGSHSQPSASTPLGANGGQTNEAVGAGGVGPSGANGDGVNVLSEKELAEQRLSYLMEQLSTKNEEIRQYEESRGTGSAAKRKDSEGKKREAKSMLTDSYYVSTGSIPQNQAGPGDKAESAPPFLEDKKADEEQNRQEENDEDDDDDEDEDDEEDDGPTAPIELMSEFLDAIMEEDYETADKLCKMILIYEPENAECLQFKPLIEEMLKKEWEHQLWGSSSEEESGDDDDDDEEDDEEGEDEDDDEEDSDEEESSESDSSEESEEDEADENETGNVNSSSVIIQHGHDK